MKIWLWLAQKTIPRITLYLSEHEMLAELATFFHLASEGNVGL